MVVDSGCTRTSANKGPFFTNVSPTYVRLATCNAQDTITIHEQGTLLAWAKTVTGETVEINMQNCLLSNHMAKDLLSVHQLVADSDSMVYFSSAKAGLRLADGQEIPFRLEGQLWYLDLHLTNSSESDPFAALAIFEMDEIFTTDTEEALASLPEGLTPIQILHSRFGHMSYRDLKELPKHVEGLSKADSTGRFSFCKVCALGKSTHHTGAEHQKRTVAVGELVAVDMAGPFRTPGIRQEIYATNWVDSYSGFMYVQTHANKRETVQQLRAFIAFMRAHRHVITTLRSDNAKEYISEEFRNTLLQQDPPINRHNTAPYHPTQNSTVELRWRHLKEGVRMLLEQSKLPFRYWPYAIQSACHTLNCRPSKTHVNRLSAYEIFHGKAPDADYIHSFGCAAYMNVPKQLCEDPAMSNRAIQCINLGNSLFDGRKGHYLLDTKSNRIVCSDSVRFDDTLFPLADAEFEYRMREFAENGLFPNQQMINEIPVIAEIVDEVRLQNPDVTVDPKGIIPASSTFMRNQTTLMLPELDVKHSVKGLDEPSLDDSVLSEAATEQQEDDDELEQEWVFGEEEHVMPQPKISPQPTQKFSQYGRPYVANPKYAQLCHFDATCKCDSCAFTRCYAFLANSKGKQMRSTARLRQVPYSAARSDPELWKKWFFLCVRKRLMSSLSITVCVGSNHRRMWMCCHLCCFSTRKSRMVKLYA